MSSTLIADQSEFVQLCDHLRQAGLVAFDTEFVSEHTYRPELGLLQFATQERCVAVDPYQIDDLSPWWEIMADEPTKVIIHGGQAEIRFCLSLSDRRPRNLHDIQLAEGFRGVGYPLSYKAIVSRVLKKRVHGGETRTDWRKRPLSDRQLEYALEDVKHLIPIWTKQCHSLKKHGRMEWVDSELEQMIDDLEAEATRDLWIKLPGVHRLNHRELAVVRELVNWREAEAARRDRPARQILRDDLLIELAHRQPKTVNDLMRTRDMTRPSYKRSANDFLACIKRGMDIPDEECPPVVSSGESSKHRYDDQALAQLLGMALTNRCAELGVAKQLAGTTADLKDFIRWHLAGSTGPKPKITTGWRAEVCGNMLTDLLEGRVSVRVGNPKSDAPLIFEQQTAE